MKFDWRVETATRRQGTDINLIDEMPKVITRVDRLGRCCSRAMDHDRGRASRVTSVETFRAGGGRRTKGKRREGTYVRTFYRCWGGARVRRACETRLLVGGRRQQTVSGMRGVCFERVDMIYESLPTTRLSTRGSTLPILPPPLNVSLLRNVAPLPPFPLSKIYRAYVTFRPRN